MASIPVPVRHGESIYRYRTATCKHLRKLRGDEAEEARIGGALPQKPVKAEGDEARAARATGRKLGLCNRSGRLVDERKTRWCPRLLGWQTIHFPPRQSLPCPGLVRRSLPSIPLDGELWIGRKKFQRAVSIVRRQDKTDLWKEVKFLVFDAPARKTLSKHRLEFIAQILSGEKLPYVEAHAHILCKSLEHLREELNRVEALGGEGLMLRQPGSLYEIGRSSTLLKVKTFHDDEATVIGHTAGAGKHKGRVGALQVRLKNGIEFSVGTGLSDKERSSPPAVGSLITFRYQELSDAGVPCFPSYVGVRSDLTPASKIDTIPAKETKAGKTAVSLAAPTPVAAQSSGSITRRYFEFVEGGSAKFWEIFTDGCNLTTRWGKIGTDGQTKQNLSQMPPRQPKKRRN